MDENLIIDGRIHLSEMDVFITGVTRDAIQRRDARVRRGRPPPPLRSGLTPFSFYFTLEPQVEQYTSP